MTLARHEPCQLLIFIVPQHMSQCWTQTIRLPYAYGASYAQALAIRHEMWYNSAGKET
jgi:hypothetical protein